MRPDLQELLHLGTSLCQGTSNACDQFRQLVSNNHGNSTTCIYPVCIPDSCSEKSGASGKRMYNPGLGSFSSTRAGPKLPACISRCVLGLARNADRRCQSPTRTISPALLLHTTTQCLSSNEALHLHCLKSSSCLEL